MITPSTHTVSPDQMMPLLAKYRPQLWREQTIDHAIAAIVCSPDEIADACEQFYGDRDILPTTEQQDWFDQYQINSEELQRLATRSLRLEKFKEINWGHQLDSYFLKRKGQLDRAIFSLIRIQDVGIAQELYFRLQADEQSFPELAKQYSHGPEARTGGFIGPTELGTLHPHLAHQLTASQPGQLLPPMRLGEWFVLVRLEESLPCQLDDTLRQRLLNELFENWLAGKLQSDLQRL